MQFGIIYLFCSCSSGVFFFQSQFGIIFVGRVFYHFVFLIGTLRLIAFAANSGRNYQETQRGPEIRGS